jgi:hypothetical protein
MKVALEESNHMLRLNENPEYMLVEFLIIRKIAFWFLVR